MNLNSTKLTIGGKSNIIQGITLYNNKFLVMSNCTLYISSDLKQWEYFSEVPCEKPDEYNVLEFYLECFNGIIYVFHEFELHFTIDGKKWDKLSFINIKQFILEKYNKSTSQAIRKYGNHVGPHVHEDYSTKQDIISNHRFVSNGSSIIIPALYSCHLHKLKGFIFKDLKYYIYDKLVLFNVSNEDYNTIDFGDQEIHTSYSFREHANQTKFLSLQCIASNEFFYLLINYTLYCSNDGTTWNKIEFKGRKINYISPAKNGILVCLFSDTNISSRHSNDNYFNYIPQTNELLIFNFDKNTSQTYDWLYYYPEFDIYSRLGFSKYEIDKLLISSNLTDWKEILLQPDKRLIRKLLYINNILVILFAEDVTSIYFASDFKSNKNRINLIKNTDR